MGINQIDQVIRAAKRIKVLRAELEAAEAELRDLVGSENGTGSGSDRSTLPNGAVTVGGKIVNMLTEHPGASLGRLAKEIHGEDIRANRIKISNTLITLKKQKRVRSKRRGYWVAIK